MGDDGKLAIVLLNFFVRNAQVNVTNKLYLICESAAKKLAALRLQDCFKMIVQLAAELKKHKSAPYNPIVNNASPIAANTDYVLQKTNLPFY